MVSDFSAMRLSFMGYFQFINKQYDAIDTNKLCVCVRSLFFDRYFLTHKLKPHLINYSLAINFIRYNLFLIKFYKRQFLFIVMLKLPVLSIIINYKSTFLRRTPYTACMFIAAYTSLFST